MFSYYKTFDIYLKKLKDKKMQNKLILTFFLILIATSFLTAQDNTTITKNSSGFEIFLTKNINKEISVTINNLDTTIAGTLVEVYNDSILIQTIFNVQVLILKESIAYIKIGSEKKPSTAK